MSVGCPVIGCITDFIFPTPYLSQNAWSIASAIALCRRMMASETSAGAALMYCWTWPTHAMPRHNP